jgi:hypothetical protein
MPPAAPPAPWSGAHQPTHPPPTVKQPGHNTNCRNWSPTRGSQTADLYAGIPSSLERQPFRNPTTLSPDHQAEAGPGNYRALRCEAPSAVNTR